MKPDPTIHPPATDWSHRIPPRLVQFWHDRDAMPPLVRLAVEHNVALHVGYEHVLVDDAFMGDFIGRHYGAKVLDLYASNTIPASRSDVARLMLLSEGGGFYVDARLEALGPMHTFVPPSTELLLTRFFGVPANGVIAAVPGHDLIRRALELALRNLERRYFNRNVIYATGSLCLQVALDAHGEPPNTRWRRIPEVISKRAADTENPGAWEVSWRVAQYSGIRPMEPAPVDDPWPPDADDARLATLLDDEARYVETLPLDDRLLPVVPEAAQHALNEWLTGRKDTSWLDDLAARGPFRHVALFTIGSAPVDLDFLRSVEAERLTVLSPKKVLLDAIGKQVAAGAPWLEVELVACDLHRPTLPTGTFDLVLSRFCFHRVLRIEGLFEAIARSLRPEGLLAFFEYVGRDRFQFSPRQLQHAEELLRELRGVSHFGSDAPVTSPLPMEFGPLGAARSSRIVPTARALLDERHHATCLVATLPLVLMFYLGLVDGVETVIARENQLLAAGEEGTLAYGVYAKRGEGH